MIKNEVQYKLTKTSVEGFEKRLNWLKANPEARGDLDPIIARAEEEALESMIEELNEELQDYNRTKAGHVDMGVLYSVDKIAGVLISARIAKGLPKGSWPAWSDSKSSRSSVTRHGTMPTWT